MPRPRKSPALHRLHGTARTSTILKPLRITDDSELRPSSWLPLEAKKLFREIIKFLIESETEYLSRLDRASLEAFVVNYVAWKKAELDVMKRGDIVSEAVVNRASGNIVGEKLVPNPSIRIAIARQAAMAKNVSALGFDPRSRQSVDTTPVKPNRPRTKQYDEDDDDAPVGWSDTYEIR